MNKFNFSLLCTLCILSSGCNNPVTKNYQNVVDDADTVFEPLKVKCEEQGGKLVKGVSYGSNGFSPEFSIIALCMGGEL